jgi:hypothetical protein
MQFTQSVEETDADGDEKPAAQLRHVADEVAPKFGQYFPEAHAVQPFDPMKSLYLPA